MSQIPIIIDTDPGVDDFFCIALGCAFSDVFNLRAITTIGGNNSTDVTTQNALDILKLFRRSEVPVARGAGRYLCQEFGVPVIKFHGINGLGNAYIDHSDARIDHYKAWDKIYREAVMYDGELVVVAVGPETNLAMAFSKYPQLPSMLKKIVIMGGTLTTGNVSEYAEANIYHDAEAAKIVFESGVPIDMIGLNVTRQAPLTKAILDDITDCDPKIKDVMLELIRFRHEEAMHDAIAISSMISDDIITFKDAYTHIIDGNVEKRGMSVAEYDKVPNSRVAVDINVEEYYRIMREMLRRFNFAN
ncbi:MAG: nucleoside hydrolase [Erysipelotrichaceae bacterium]|nr:nucleoside hydrolase [Erysipelotrichaceae bacterium]